VYESIDEMDPRDRPARDTIEDDDKFDNWAKDFAKRKEIEIRYGTQSSAADHSNVTVYDGFEDDTEE